MYKIDIFLTKDLKFSYLIFSLQKQNYLCLCIRIFEIINDTKKFLKKFKQTLTFRAVFGSWAAVCRPLV